MTKKYDIEIYATYNEQKPVIAERLIRTLKNKFYEYMTSVSKNVHIDKLDDIISKYNNTYHRTITINPADVKSNTYSNTGKKINNKDPKSKVDDHIRILKQKYFCKKLCSKLVQRSFCD